MRRSAAAWCSCFLLLGLSALAVGPVWGNDWPQYRGPDRQGTVPESGLLETWEDGQPRIVWRRAIGTGYSAVAAAGGRLFTMDADTEEEAVFALGAERVGLGRRGAQYVKHHLRRGERQAPDMGGSDAQSDAVDQRDRGIQV